MIPVGRRREAVLSAVFLAVLFLAYLVLDAFGAVSARWSAIAFVVLFAVTVGWVGLHELTRKSRVAVFLIYATAVVAVRWIDLGNPGRKAFVRDLYGLRSGMSRGQVEPAMRNYSRTPWHGTMDDGRTKAFVNADIYTCTNNSDWGMVVYDENERVDRVQFVPD